VFPSTSATGVHISSEKAVPGIFSGADGSAAVDCAYLSTVWPGVSYRGHLGVCFVSDCWGCDDFEFLGVWAEDKTGYG
jgi:hypothetical protein